MTFFVNFEKVALDFFSPFDGGQPLWFFPLGVEFHSVEELFDPDDLDGLLLFFGSLKVDNRAEV